jgi:hypothetical protein
LLFVLTAATTVSAGEPMITITGCDQVELNGHTYPRFTFQVHNSADIPHCQLLFSQGPGSAPADTCTMVAAIGPPDWQNFVIPSTAHWISCFGTPIGAGETVSGLQIVVTRPCCGEFSLFNPIGPVVRESACLQCPTPAERATWGVVKSRYR